ncbi:hypothetical protein HPB50_001739 [Hyalomma asiaticum]|uniref:Uncharacterized protein n=1 Tax=Hyalomma asiaticum TaxID=266040 RepID=A0ACB7RNU8_HYAAI|nr:hypothetical protein HPB50_001739 [Hyalomma asiaticum]
MGKKAVKILDISNGDSIEFNEAGLESILLADHVKDLPVVVVSVAGEFRQGKSFLLNFFLRYLRNEGRPNWMDDRRTPLQGFEWRAGSDRHTTGIMLWEEAFVVTRSSGEKVAVLLMDTQGTFDGQSTQRESSTIFSLSVMMSSVQIYNIMRNIGDNHLQQLQFFAEYGRMAQQEAGTPFQQLLFLVRDWPKRFGKSYGAQGGRELLNDRLMTNKGEKEEKRLQREWIESCFSDVGCFLMPSPGEKVAEDETFDGRLDDIKEVFREKVRELVHSVLAPEKLLVKDIDGRKLSCRELATYFKELEEYFSRIFREEELAIQNEQAMEAVALDAQRKLEEMQLERAKEIAEAAARYARMEAEIERREAPLDISPAGPPPQRPALVPPEPRNSLEINEVLGMIISPLRGRDRSPDPQLLEPGELTPVHQRASRPLRGDPPEFGLLPTATTTPTMYTADTATMASPATLSDLVV